MAKREEAPTSMIKAAILTSHSDLPWKRQFLNGITKISDIEFFVPVDSANLVVVYDALPQKKVRTKSSQHAIFVAPHPETVKRYPAGFLAQFDTVITTDRVTPHPNRIFSHAGFPWFVGSNAGGNYPHKDPMSFEELGNHFPTKTKLVSVVLSDEVFTPEHRARLEFVSRLKEAFGDQLDIYGRRILDFADKRDVLDAYRYHIALENCSIEDYWTEKLADPFLTLTFPIYHGCPNIVTYFPEGALRSINILEPETAIHTIKEVITSDLAEQNLEYLLEARRRVMQEHNVFHLLARVIKRQAVTPTKAPTSAIRILRSERYYLPLKERLTLELKDFFAAHPKVRSLLRRVKQAVLDIREIVRFNWLYATDIFFRSHQRWISENPNSAIRYNYDLPHGARILDVGGYRGDFAEQLLKKHGASVTICEPIPKFASQIQDRFMHEPRIVVHEFGLSDRNEQVEFDLSADASGVFGTSAGPKITVLLRDAKEFLLETGVPEWHLLKLNIEGGEYALLERLIETGLIERMQHLQVQFHLHVPDAKAKYKRIAKLLRRTHQLEWRYPFVWESWRRLQDDKKSR